MIIWCIYVHMSNMTLCVYLDVYTRINNQWLLDGGVIIAFPNIQTLIQIDWTFYLGLRVTCHVDFANEIAVLIQFR
jgi:hypothetical protein